LTGVYDKAKPDIYTGSVYQRTSEYHTFMSSDLNKRRILGVLGGCDLSPERIASWARSADFVVAADGGANPLFENGIVPDLTIGDFDSIKNSTKEAQKMLVYAPDQDRSDCDKLLAYLSERGCTRLTICGFEGDLVDHLIGTIHSVAQSNLEVRLVTRRGIIWLLRGPSSVSLPVPADTRLSMLPVTLCKAVSIQGVEWPLADAEMSPLGMSSLSNRSLGPVQISIGSGVACVFLSHASLEKPHWPE